MRNPGLRAGRPALEIVVYLHADTSYPIQRETTALTLLLAGLFEDTSAVDIAFTSQTVLVSRLTDPKLARDVSAGAALRGTSLLPQRESAVFSSVICRWIA